MAAAATAVGSYLSATETRRRLRFDSAALRANSARVPSLQAISHFTDEVLSITSTASDRRSLMRITAAVAQEEAAAVEEEQESKVEEEEGAQAKESAAEAEVPLQSTKLYFGNLPYHCDSAHLAGIIQDHASPEMVEVLYDKDTGRSRGFAFVTMSTLEDCEVVISNLNGSQYGGRTMRVNFSDKPKPKEPLYPESKYKLFVGNLSWSVTSEALTQVFREYGNLVGARVLYDGETGRSRGYGFVCYTTKEEMDAAMDSLNGVELEGRAMRISIALGKKLDRLDMA